MSCKEGSFFSADNLFLIFFLWQKGKNVSEFEENFLFIWKLEIFGVLFVSELGKKNNLKVLPEKLLFSKQLLLTNISDGDSMIDYSNKFVNTVDLQNEMYIEEADALLYIFLLYSNPSIYENFRCAIKARDGLSSTGGI